MTDDAYPSFGAEEDCCADCRRTYTCWWADSDLWNLVIRKRGAEVTIDGIEPYLCASCFMLRAQPIVEIIRVTWSHTISRRDWLATSFSPITGAIAPRNRDAYSRSCPQCLAPAWHRCQQTPYKLRASPHPRRVEEWVECALPGVAHAPSKPCAACPSTGKAKA